MLRQETWSFTNPPVRREHVSMKILTNLSRFLLGLIFLVFGLNGFLHFIPMPPPSGVAGQFLGAMFVSRYLLVVSVFFFQAEDGIRDLTVTGVQTCALPI